MSFVGVEYGCKYTLTGPDGTVAVFNDSTSPYYVGMLSPESSGLDGSEVREDSADRVEADGAIHGAFFAGRRPVILTGTIDNGGSATVRNERVGRLQAASKALREDAILTWKPLGAPEELQVSLRLQQPLRITKGFVKDFQVSMVAADPGIYGTAVKKDEWSGQPTTLPVTSVGPAEGIVFDGTYLYWTRGDSRIARVKPNGEEKNASFITTVTSALLGIATDGTYLYYARQEAAGYVGRIKLNGTSMENTWLKTEGEPTHIEVDGTYIYITDFSTGYIKRAKLNGTELNKTWVKGYVSSTAETVWALALDSQYIYWSTLEGKRIGRAKIDGTGANASFVTLPAGVGGLRSLLVVGDYIYGGSGSRIIRARKTDGGDFMSEYAGPSAPSLDLTIDAAKTTFYGAGTGALMSMPLSHTFVNSGTGEVYPIIRFVGPTNYDTWIEYNNSRILITAPGVEFGSETDEIVIDTYAGTITLNGVDIYDKLSFSQSANFFQPLPAGSSVVVAHSAKLNIIEYVAAYA